MSDQLSVLFPLFRILGGLIGSKPITSASLAGYDEMIMTLYVGL